MWPLEGEALKCGFLARRTNGMQPHGLFRRKYSRNSNLKFGFELKTQKRGSRKQKLRRSKAKRLTMKVSNKT